MRQFGQVSCGLFDLLVVDRGSGYYEVYASRDSKLYRSCWTLRAKNLREALQFARNRFKVALYLEADTPTVELEIATTSNEESRRVA